MLNNISPDSAEMNPIIKINPLSADPNGLKYVIIITKFRGKWVFVRNRQRVTWEIPGGHIDPGEAPDFAASRELMEETGAEEFSIRAISDYSVEIEGTITTGRLYFAEITKIGNLPEYEIAEVILLDQLPDKLTYPLIQPILFESVKRSIKILKL
jgi:8-oxo-dGTP diphosphatase